VVETTSAGAEQHIDALGQEVPRQDTYPFRRAGQQRIILRIQPVRINSIGLE